MAKKDAKQGSTNSVSTNGTSTNAIGACAGAKRKDGKIRVAIIGVGNCASSLIQGRYYYENAR